VHVDAVGDALVRVPDDLGPQFPAHALFVKARRGEMAKVVRVEAFFSGCDNRREPRPSIPVTRVYGSARLVRKDKVVRSGQTGLRNAACVDPDEPRRGGAENREERAAIGGSMPAVRVDDPPPADQ